MPDREDKESYLSVIYSLPKWLVSHWLKEYGEEAVEQMGTAFLQAAPTTVRLNLNRMEKEDILKLLKEEGVTVSEGSGDARGIISVGGMIIWQGFRVLERDFIRCRIKVPCR